MITGYYLPRTYYRLNPSAKQDNPVREGCKLMGCSPETLVTCITV